MPKRLGKAERDRGERVRVIREALGVSQYDFSALLNESAKRLGLPEVYKFYTVSRMEAGSVSFEDAAVCLALDPSRKASEPLRWDWFVFGEPQKKRASEPRERKIG